MKNYKELYIEFSNNYSQVIYNIINTVRKQVLVLWEKSRENINNNIHTSLNKIFCWKIQIKNFIVEKLQYIGPLNLNNEKGEKIISVNVILHSVDSNSNNELYKQIYIIFLLLLMQEL